MLGNNLVEFGHRQGDKLLIGILFGADELGIYALGYRLYRTINMLLMGFVSQVSISSFSALQGDKARAEKVFSRASEIAATVAFPIFAIVAAIAPQVLPYVVGTEWQLSAVVLQVFCFAGALECVLFFNASVLISMGKPHWKFGLGIINLAINNIGYFIFWTQGIIYFALVYAARAYMTSPLSILCVKKLIPLSVPSYIRTIFESALAAVVVFFLARWLNKLPIISDLILLRAFFVCVLCACTYLVLILLIKPQLLKFAIALITERVKK
jgi:PST family polysaccharide transporter